MENKIQVAGQTITIGQLRMIQEDIATWKEAVMNADLVTRPNRQRLVELYKNIIKDSRLKSLKNKRIRSIKNTPCLYHDKDGKVNIETTALFETPWFVSLLTQIMEAQFWGFSVVEFYVNEKGITDIFLLPRQNINADRREILVQMGAIKGISYLQEPYSKFIVDIHAEDRLGLLLEAAPLVLYKRGALADWAQFSELFGMPIREYTYNPNNPDSRKEAEKAAKEAGSASYLVVPEGTGLKLHKGVEGSQTGGVYDAMRLAMNEELAILILGQTMTTTDGSSRSQAEVHESVEEDIHLEDRLWVEAILNHKIKPILLEHGYKVADGYFEFDKTENINIQTQLDMDIKLNAVVPIDPDYFASKYNVPLAKVKPQEPPPATKPKEALKKKALNSLYLSSLHLPSVSVSLSSPLLWGGVEGGAVFEDFTSDLDALMNKIIKLIHNEQIDLSKPFDSKELEKLQKVISDFLLQGLDAGYTDFDYTTQDKELLEKLRDNLYIFAAYKDYNLMQDMGNFLFDVNGNIRSFADFKRDALQIHSAYNKNWLLAEYNTTIASGQAAAKWVRIMADKETFPLLTYRTQGDRRVRDAHKSLAGITRPIEDDFWKTHYPPNAYQCRCYTEQNESDYEVTPDERVKDIPEPPKIFANNVGISGKVFTENHPYFEVSKKVKNYVDKAIDNMRGE